MELAFLASCVAVGVAITIFTCRITTRKMARTVSRIYLLFALALLASSIVLSLLTKEVSYISHEICGMCGGNGIEEAGSLCLACQGSGNLLVSGTSYSIPWLYPICMICLGVYALFLQFALEEGIADLIAESPVPAALFPKRTEKEDRS